MENRCGLILVLFLVFPIIISSIVLADEGTPPQGCISDDGKTINYNDPECINAILSAKEFPANLDLSKIDPSIRDKIDLRKLTAENWAKLNQQSYDTITSDEGFRKQWLQIASPEKNFDFQIARDLKGIA